MDNNANMASRYEHEIPEGYEARIEGNKVIIELKESEDERIRREIIDDIQKHHPCWQLYKDYTSWIHWLEKQGNKGFWVERVFAEAGIKPAYKDGNSWCVLIGKNIQEGICGFGETPKDAYVNFLKELWGKAFEQKTSEWSEDDNAKIEFLCNLIKRNISEGTYSFGDGAKNGFVSKQEAIKMLESLKSRVQPQPKSEWSDEDEGIVSRITNDLENCYNDYLQKDCHYMEQAYKYVAVELVTGAAELPDIWGFNGWDSVLVEVKTSHSDFIADQKKRVRKEENNKYKLGNYRYYLCPDGTIKESELPDGWGLLVYDGKTIRKEVQSQYHDVYNTSELMLLASILAREVGRSKIFNYRKVEKDAPNESDLSWRDMQRIVKIADYLCNSLEYEKIKKMGEEGYYTEILERFNKEKYGNTQK